MVYQTISLNVAVNSYDHALLTLLMSNQFVEIKGSVFKKFEKDNLFQITCAGMEIQCVGDGGSKGTYRGRRHCREVYPLPDALCCRFPQPYRTQRIRI